MKRIYLFPFFLITLLAGCRENPPGQSIYQQAESVLRDSVLQVANLYLSASPVTVTASVSPRSAGGIHDFFSEGDYWWPDSANPDGPYIHRDGLTNPDNFTDHREALIRLSELAGTLASAWRITGEAPYAEATLRHCRAWFLNDSTKMTPHLLYAQAIQGRHTGRGIGIIDGIHFMEVVQALRVLEAGGMVDEVEMAGYKVWFGEFLSWLTSHPYGIDERDHPNNHGTCWNMQVGLYASFVGADSVFLACRDNYTNHLLPDQMASDGSFPLELERTKPYGYSLFNLDAMAMNVLILSDDTTNLWEFSLPDGRSIGLALAYMAPFVADKNAWPLEPDVMYWNQWPVAQPAFVLGAAALGKPEYLDLWRQFDHFPQVFEVKRNLPIRNPLLWLQPEHEHNH